MNRAIKLFENKIRIMISETLRNMLNEHSTKYEFNLRELLEIINNDAEIIRKLNERGFTSWEFEPKKFGDTICFYKNNNFHGQISYAYTDENDDLWIVCFSMFGGETTQGLDSFMYWV